MNPSPSESQVFELKRTVGEMYIFLATLTINIFLFVNFINKNVISFQIKVINEFKNLSHIKII